MKEKNDPVLPMLENVDKPEKMNEYMDQYFPTKKSLMPKEQQEKYKRKVEKRKVKRELN